MVHSPLDDRFRVIATASPHPRRAVSRALAALPLAGAALLAEDIAAARRRRRRAAPHAEKKKKKATFCLNGTTVSASKKKKKKLLKQGATSGACAPTPACTRRTWTAQSPFGTTGSGSGQFNFPSGLVRSADNRTLWIADAVNARIAVWTRADDNASWTQATTFGSGPGTGPSQFSNAYGLAVSPDGRTVWVGDGSNNRISVWTRPNADSTAWSNQTTFGSGPGAGPTQFQFPKGVAASREGLTVFVADYVNSRISVWSRGSASSTTWTHETTFGSNGSATNQFNGPASVVAAADGLTVWVSEYFNNRISVWARPNPSSTTWINQTTFGSPGSAAHQLNGPGQAALSPDELTIWITDRNNNRISVWSRPNAGSDAWSPVGTFGSLGVRPTELQDPNGVAVSSDGLTIWVGDTENDRIAVWANACTS